ELRSHALTLLLSHSALPRPCFRVLETKSHRFRFGSSVGFNAMIVVLLIGGQQAREAASTFGEFAHLEGYRAECSESAASVSPIGAAVARARLADAELLRRRQCHGRRSRPLFAILAHLSADNGPLGRWSCCRAGLLVPRCAPRRLQDRSGSPN